jgi:hypothetical protein
MNYREKHTTQFDNLTGEVTHSESIVSYEKKIPTEPPYIKLYTSDIGSLCGLTAGATRVLIPLTSLADYEDEISLSRGLKERIARDLEVSLSLVNNAVTELVKKEVIYRIGSEGSGLYGLNPVYFARGKWRDIYEKRKALKITITYTDKGKNGKREIVTEQGDGDVIQLFNTNESSDI